LSISANRLRVGLVIQYNPPKLKEQSSCPSNLQSSLDLLSQLPLKHMYGHNKQMIVLNPIVSGREAIPNESVYYFNLKG